MSHERYIPYIIETSAGLTRTVLVILCDAYDEEIVEGEKRVVMRFHPAHRARSPSASSRW